MKEERNQEEMDRLGWIRNKVMYAYYQASMDDKCVHRVAFTGASFGASLGFIMATATDMLAQGRTHCAPFLSARSSTGRTRACCNHHQSVCVCTC